MGTVPIGTGLLRMIHSRVSWMLRPVDRSMTVSAPQRIDHTILSTSVATSLATAVADIGVDLDQEIAADRHRLAFGVVDVVGDDRAAARYFVADEFGGDIIGNAGAPVDRKSTRLNSSH